MIVVVVLRFVLVSCLVSFLLFSEVEKLLFSKFVFQKDIRTRLRNQCKEMFKVLERNVTEKKKWITREKDWPHKYCRVMHKLQSMS